MKRIAILQSSYIPWKGFFDIINSVDQFVWYDDVQFTLRDWRSRNRIKTKDGLLWLSVPCFHKGSPIIQEVKISDSSWQKKHWNSITHAYSKAPYFVFYKEFFEELYLRCHWEFLSEMNKAFVEKISVELLGIKTTFLNSNDYNAQGAKQDRLLDLIKKIGCDTYFSGPAAKDYIDENEFKLHNIKLEWMDYKGYPTYPQLHGEFEHAVSIIDLLFNVGPEAPKYIWGWREGY